MNKNTNTSLGWKDWYDKRAKEAAQMDDGFSLILGIITGIVDPIHGCTDAQRIARIRYLLAAYDAAKKSLD